MKAIFRILGTAAAVAATGAAIVIMDKLLNEKAAPIIESIEFPEEAEKDDAEAAKTAEALRVMNQKIRDRELEKLYLCTVLGRPTPSAGTLEGFIVKDEAKKQVSIRSKPVPGGRKAITKYRTLATKGNLSLVECDLITGRTHQIRVHMASIGHPVLGDPVYGPKKSPYPVAGGQLLHAYRIGFVHPATGEEMLFEAPPEERFQKWLEKLRLPQ